MIAIIGNTVSPYVRKVLTVLIIKGLDFEIDPITPFYGDDDFARLSPMRRIPVLIDGDLVINDSTVIAQYLEEKYPAPSILPATPELRAKARWFEEYADDRLGDAFVWKGFGAVVVAPAVFGTPRDLDAFQRHLDSDVAAICDYLDSVAPADGFLAGPFSIADIAIASMFRPMRYARWSPDPTRWPRLAALLARAEAHPALAATGEWSDALVKTHPSGQRDKAKEIGLKVTARSHFSGTPRRGPMTRIGAGS